MVGENGYASRRRFLATTTMAGLVMVSPRALAATAPKPADGYRREMPFDDAWRFMRADMPGAHDPRFDDRSWTLVDLPHDWSIEDLPGSPRTTAPWVAPAAIWSDPAPARREMFDIGVPPPSLNGPPLRVGPFDPLASAGKANTGWVVGGSAWYRKHFTCPDLRSGDRVELRFDGSFQDTEVWLNGVSLGTNIYGYGAFAFDLTGHLRTEGTNLLAVRVRNEGETSRWYSGSGLYRHVWLTVTDAVRVAPWGVWIHTPTIEAHAARTLIEVDIDNAHAAEQRVDVEVVLRDPAGQVVARGTNTIAVGARASGLAVVDVQVPSPRLWGPDHPALYEAEVMLAVGGRSIDRLTTRFGIRAIKASAEHGLTINGQPVKLKGACLHADNGMLGAAAIDRAEIRKVEIMKRHGYNAIRMGHQMFSPAFINACDELGMILIDEVFDTWEKSKWLNNDYSKYFKDNWKHDLTRMVRQHRNHPSILFWSIGNEIPEAADPRGVEIATELRKTVLALDSSRLITEAIAVPLISGTRGEVARRSLDVAGYNYGASTYEDDHRMYPKVVMMGTEQWSRDMYEGWRKVESCPWVIGEFIWTGMDYIGEVGSGSSELRPIGGTLPETSYVTSLWDYPAYLAGCGEIDINGRRKPQGLYRDVLWHRSSLELLVQRPIPADMYERVSDWGWHDELESWTWPVPVGQLMTVRAYTPCDTVRLMLNDSLVAERHLAETDKLKAEFTVPFAPGKLVAIAYKHGSEIARKELATVGPPARIHLRAERDRIDSSPNDLGYVWALVCDAQGRKVPDAVLPLTFSVTGMAALRATGSANPRGLKSFRSADCTTFHGEALAIVQPGRAGGQAVVTVRSPGLPDAELTLAVG